MSGFANALEGTLAGLAERYAEICVLLDRAERIERLAQPPVFVLEGGAQLAPFALGLSEGEIAAHVARAHGERLKGLKRSLYAALTGVCQVAPAQIDAFAAAVVAQKRETEHEGDPPGTEGGF